VDAYTLNEQFLSSLGEGSLSVVHAYHSNDPGSQDVDLRISQALGWRLEVVEAAAVKRAKRDAATTPMALSALVDAVVSDVQPFFAATRRDVLAAIKDLVGKGFLCRTPSAGPSCRYQIGISYCPATEMAEEAAGSTMDRQGSVSGWPLVGCGAERGSASSDALLTRIP
jgi:hypothetical protein